MSHHHKYAAKEKPKIGRFPRLVRGFRRWPRDPNHPIRCNWFPWYVIGWRCLWIPVAIALILPLLAVISIGWGPSAAKEAWRSLT